MGFTSGGVISVSFKLKLIFPFRINESLSVRMYFKIEKTTKRLQNSEMVLFFFSTKATKKAANMKILSEMIQR